MNKIVISNNKAGRIFKKYLGEITDFEKFPFKIGPAEIENFSDRELYDYCRFTGINARIWTRRFVAAIPEVARRGLYRKYGFHSIYEFSSKISGLSHKTVNETLRIYEKFKEMPKMKELIGEVGLSKLRVVACIVTVENEWFWAKKAVDMSRPALEVLIREIKKEEEKKIIEQNKSNKLPFINAQNNEIDNSTKIENIDPSNKIIEPQNNPTLWPKFPWEPDLNESDTFSKPERVNFSVPIDKDTEFQLRKFKLHLEKERKQVVDWNKTLKELVMRAEK